MTGDGNAQRILGPAEHYMHADRLLHDMASRVAMEERIALAARLLSRTPCWPRPTRHSARRPGVPLRAYAEASMANDDLFHDHRDGPRKPGVHYLIADESLVTSATASDPIDRRDLILTAIAHGLLASCGNDVYTEAWHERRNGAHD